MLPKIQCPKCKYGKTFKWNVDVNDIGNELGNYFCKKFEKIPEFVIMAQRDCPKFEAK